MAKLMRSKSSHKLAREQDFMIMNGRSLCPGIVMLVVAFSSITFLSCTADAGDDPLDWRPPAIKAQFRKLLPDADFERLSSPIVSRLAPRPGRRRPAIASAWLPVPSLPLRRAPEAALDFWYEAEHNGGSEPLDPLLGYRVMIANHKLEQARDLCKHPKLFPNIAEGLETLVALHRARSAEQRGTPPPSVQGAACTTVMPAQT